MQKIIKRTEPTFLAHYRKLKDADWDNDVKKPERDEARTQLCVEQGSLCCFCEGRIRANEDDMKIAHFVPQSVDKSLMFTWSNLLGACKGGEGNPPKRQHCDTKQGKEKLNPRLHPVTLSPGSVDFNVKGELLSSDQETNTDLNDKLNLNLNKLVKNRRSAVDAMITQMGKEHWKESEIEKKLKELSSATVAERIEYQSYLVWWLRRRVRKAA
jgi:uncharacterized protein (TIGR02646 family)